MKWLLAAGVLGGIGWWGYAWWTQEEPDASSGDDLMRRYEALLPPDPEDSSKLETLKRIARAQERR